MAKVNIRESLGRIDLLTDNKYDLRNTYDSSNLSNDKKNMLIESISKNKSAEDIYNILKEDFEDDDFDPKYDARYEVNSFYGRNYSGLEDDLYTDDFEEVKDWVWSKVQSGGYIEVSDREKGKSVRLDPDSYDWESDDAYRVLDDLEELSPLNEDAYAADGDSLGDLLGEGQNYKETLEDAIKWCNRYKEDQVILFFGYPIGYIALSEQNYHDYPEDFSDGKIVARVKYEDGNAKVLKEEVEEDEEDKVSVFTKSNVDGKTYFRGFMNKEEADKHFPDRLKEAYIPSDRFIKRDKDILKREISKGKAWDEVLVNLGYECVDPSCTYWSKDTDDGTIVFSFEDFDEEDEIEDKEIHCSMVDNNGNVVSEDSFKVKINESLKEAIEDEVDFDEYDFEETDFNDGEVQHGDTFIEDGREWTWIERIAGPIHLDFDNWAVWSARDWDYIQEKIKPILLNKENLTIETLTKIYDEAEIAYFVVDEDTGFIDWGPVESQTEAQDFLNGKVEDWENDEYDESLKESKQLKEWYDYTLFYDDIEDGNSYEYDVDYDKLFDRIAELAVDEDDTPQDAESYLNWVEDNFDRLYNKFEYDILEYFYEDAYQDYYDNKITYSDYIQDQRTEDSLLNDR